MAFSLPVFLSLALAVLTVVNLALYRRLRRLDACWRAECSRQSERLQGLSEEIGALCSGASGMGEHLSRVEQQVRRLNERQDQLELRDPVNREYHQAVKMIRNGAGLEELMEACGLVRAEAELLMRLHAPGRASPQREDAASSSS
ncbi:MAG TPA: DUF2802 domain-containing protein [Gammaproteobacteria bacterium]|nr:DUF2802 domain-containing protein [Gammaproteobacteria bacterium]